MSLLGLPECVFEHVCKDLSTRDRLSLDCVSHDAHKLVSEKTNMWETFEIGFYLLRDLRVVRFMRRVGVKDLTVLLPETHLLTPLLYPYKSILLAFSTCAPPLRTLRLMSPYTAGPASWPRFAPNHEAALIHNIACCVPTIQHIYTDVHLVFDGDATSYSQLRALVTPTLVSFSEKQLFELAPVDGVCIGSAALLETALKHSRLVRLTSKHWLPRPFWSNPTPLPWPPSVFAALSAAPRLTHLWIKADDGVRNCQKLLEHLPSGLQALHLTGFYVRSLQLPAGLKNLEFELCNLRALNLEEVRGLTQLERLVLIESDVRAAVLVFFCSACPQLVGVDMPFQSVSVRTLRAIADKTKAHIYATGSYVQWDENLEPAESQHPRVHVSGIAAYFI